MSKLNYNPYDLVKIVLNGEETNARPTSFSSTITNDCYDSLGRLITPTILSTTCNRCGELLNINVKFDQYPFNIINIYCKCSEFKDPFLPIKFPKYKKDGEIESIENLDNFENDLDDFIINVVNITDKKQHNIKIQEL